MLKDAKVLVAGGTGFIGVNLIKRLLDEGASVRATIHRKAPVIPDDRIEYVQCELTSMDDCKKVVEGMDYVFLCAASTSGAAVIASTPLVHVTPNIIMNSQMLEAAYFARVKKFIWLSSNAAYPPSADRPVKEDEMFDGDPYETYFGVAWMKRYTEILCRMYSEKLKDPLATVVIRPSNVYGPYDDYEFETSHVMAALIRRVVERHDPFEVWGTGDDVRDWIYIDDFIDAMILATEKLDSFQPINVGLGESYSIKQALKIMLEVDGYADANVVYDSSKPSMIPIRIIDTSLAEKLLGFKAKTGLREGIIKTIDWYRKNRSQ
ncbi:NAD-dependent epimerase/dehydratase family protein [Chloroflexota bacterium]